MKNYRIKYFFAYLKQQKNLILFYLLIISIPITALFFVEIKVMRIITISFIIFLLLLFSLSVIFRKKKFKVYLSFSEIRIPQWARYITNYLKLAFKAFNIDYYDFREYKRINIYDERAICNAIYKNLSNSDIFLRFIDKNLEPYRISHADDFNEWLDYSEYEINVSYDEFGFINPYNRVQIVAPGIGLAPMNHIHSIFVDPQESEFDFALRVIEELTAGYKELQNIKRRG